MWMFIMLGLRPDARCWPGRRMLALVDAVIWPAAAAAGILQIPVQTGTFGQVMLAVCGVAAVRRAWRAGLVNHRYRFTTASAFGPLAVLLVVAATLKIAA